MLPVPTGSVNGVTTFKPAGVFGLYGGLGGDTSFTDDGLNWGSNTSPRVYLHNVRVFQAYDVNRVLIPDTYILADDPGRNPGGKNNDYQVDWESQRSKYFSGLPGIWVQDAACQEGMGPISDRSEERLGSSDAGIIQARRLLMRLARLLNSDGVLPTSAADPSVMRVRSVGTVLARNVSWVDATRKLMTAHGGFGYEIPAG